MTLDQSIVNHTEDNDTLDESYLLRQQDSTNSTASFLRFTKLNSIKTKSGILTKEEFTELFMNRRLDDANLTKDYPHILEILKECSNYNKRETTPRVSLAMSVLGFVSLLSFSFLSFLQQSVSFIQRLLDIENIRRQSLVFILKIGLISLFFYEDSTYSLYYNVLYISLFMFILKLVRKTKVTVIKSEQIVPSKPKHVVISYFYILLRCISKICLHFFLSLLPSYNTERLNNITI